MDNDFSFYFPRIVCCSDLLCIFFFPFLPPCPNSLFLSPNLILTTHGRFLASSPPFPVHYKGGIFLDSPSRFVYSPSYGVTPPVDRAIPFFFFPPVWQASPHKPPHNDVFKISLVLVSLRTIILLSSNHHLFPFYSLCLPIPHVRCRFLSFCLLRSLSVSSPSPSCLLAAGPVSRSRTSISQVL